MSIETKYFSIDDLYNLDNKSKFWKFIEGEVKVALSKSSMSSSKKADALNLFKKQYIQILENCIKEVHNWLNI